MSVFIVPHHVTQTQATIWVAWWLRIPLPKMTLIVQEEGGAVQSQTTFNGGFEVIGRNGPKDNTIECKYKVHPLDNLTSNTAYNLELVQESDGRVLARSTFETLPSSLPTASSSARSKRPFTILLGSCYSERHDTGKSVDRAYELL